MGVFDHDELIQGIELLSAGYKRDAARQTEDERAREQATHDAEVTSKFREILLEHFDGELLEICDRSLSPATTAGYDGEFKRFAKWCQDFGISSLPASPEAAAGYLAEQLEDGASYGAIKRAHAALSYQHRIRGLADPCPGPDPSVDADAYDATSKPFAAAVLRRARNQAKQKSANSSIELKSENRINK
jgi:hypothetical protein